MNIAKGIQGIRKFRSDNERGWHLVLDGKYVAYVDLTVTQVFSNLEDKDYTFIGWCGTGLTFSSKKR